MDHTAPLLLPSQSIRGGTSVTPNHRIIPQDPRSSVCALDRRLIRKTSTAPSAGSTQDLPKATIAFGPKNSQSLIPLSPPIF